MTTKQEIKRLLKDRAPSIVDERILPETLDNIAEWMGELMGKLTTLDPEADQKKVDETAKRREARPLISWFNTVVGSSGATAGGTAGTFIGGPAGTVVGSLTGGSVAVGITSLLNSTWYNTLQAVQKAKLAEKLTEIGSLNAAKYWVQILNSQGTKAINQFLSTPKEQLNQPPQ